MREEIARVVPFYDGVQRLKQIGDAIQYGGPHLCAGWKFPTPDGKAHFRAVPLPNLSHRMGEGSTVRVLGNREAGGSSSLSPSDGERAGVRGTFVVATRRGKQFNSLIYADV